MGQDLKELFDVVDGRDRVIGRAPRRDVHAKGLRHRAVHVLVFNGAGRVFLHKRSMTKDTAPGKWDSSCAGHVGAGEDYDITAVRELEEEIGLKLPDNAATERPAGGRLALERILRIEARPETGQEFVWVYRTLAEGPFALNPDEIERGDWFDSTEVDRWLAERPDEFASAFAYLWPLVRAKL